MNIAHPDGMLGHIDEVVLSMKSEVFTSHGGPSLNPQNSPFSQKLKIFSSVLSELPPAKASQSIKVSYDRNLGLSQHSQLLN